VEDRLAPRLSNTGSGGTTSWHFYNPAGSTSARLLLSRPSAMASEVSIRAAEELLICDQQRYRVYQINGQKHVKLLDPDQFPEPMSEVFASNLPRDLSVETLFVFFLRCGKIFEVRLLMDYSGSNRGKCFVRYMRVEASRRAVCCLDNEPITDDHRVAVNLSMDNTQLILKRIPACVPDDWLRAVIWEAMGEGLVNISMKPSRIPFSKYCFCTFVDHQFAMRAHRKVWPFIHLGPVVSISVNWAVPKLLRHVSLSGLWEILLDECGIVKYRLFI
jgi:hypothetical protein